MIGQLVQVCCSSGSSPELIDPVENSSREVVELRAEVERLRRENLEFRQQVGYWKSRHRDALLRIAALEQKIEQLEGEKQQLHADLFGRRSETKPLRRCAKITSATPSGMIKNACFPRVLSVIAPAPLLKLFLRTA